MTASSIKVAFLTLNKETGELVPQLEENLLVIPQVGKSDDFIPKLVLVQPNGAKTSLKALQLNDLEECPDARAFALHTPSESKYLWCTRELSDAEYQKFKDAFVAYKRAYLEVNLTMAALLANIRLFPSMSGFAAAKQLVLIPYFQNHASVFEACLEQDPSLVDFEYASDLVNHPDRRSSLYDYLLYLSRKNQ